MFDGVCWHAAMDPFGDCVWRWTQFKQLYNYDISGLLKKGRMQRELIWMRLALLRIQRIKFIEIEIMS